MGQQPDQYQQNKAHSKDWDYHPDLPLKITTPFDRPLLGQNLWRWFRASWLQLATLPLWLMFAFINWLFLHPSQVEMQHLQLSWIWRVALCNAAALLLVAGGLHLYFYTFNQQAQHRKFDAKQQPSNSPRFLFRDQVKDNMFWSLTSGLAFWTGFQVLYFWAWANGYAPWASLEAHPFWFVIWLPLISLWSSFHFYCVHRLLHWPVLYKRVHSLHHRMVNVGPWSGIAMHPVEHLLYFSSVAIHFIVPSSPVHIIYHLYLQALNPAVSHSGYDGLEVDGEIVFSSGDFFHQLHHRFLHCNYGTSEFPLDRWFGSHHNGTDECTRTIQQQMRELNARKRKGSS